MSLEAEGFRFVLQDGEFGWVHPNLLKPEAIDLTDMPEREFNAFVEFREPPVGCELQAVHGTGRSCQEGPGGIDLE